MSIGGMFNSSSASSERQEQITAETGQQFNNAGAANAFALSGFRLNKDSSLTLTDQGALDSAYQVSRDALAAIDRTLSVMADQANSAIESGFSAARRTEQSVMEYGTTQAVARSATIKNIGMVAIAIAAIIALVMFFKK